MSRLRSLLLAAPMAAHAGQGAAVDGVWIDEDGSEVAVSSATREIVVRGQQGPVAFSPPLCIRVAQNGPSFSWETEGFSTQELRAFGGGAVSPAAAALIAHLPPAARWTGVSAGCGPVGEGVVALGPGQGLRILIDAQSATMRAMWKVN